MGLFGKKDKGEDYKMVYQHVDGLPSYGELELTEIRLIDGILKMQGAVNKTKPVVNLEANRVTAVEFLMDKEIEEITKNKSVVGRALVGSLAGPLGAVIGGLSGVGDKKKVKKNTIFLLVITYDMDKKIILKQKEGQIYLKQSKLISALREHISEDIATGNHEINL